MKFKLAKVLALFAIFVVVLYSAASLSSTFAEESTAIIDPLIIPKWENQLTGPPSVFQPHIATDNGVITRYDYNITMSAFQEQILPFSMNLMTPVWGYGGLAKDAVTGASLGFVQSAPGPTFETEKGIPVQVKWINNITTPFLFPVDPTIHWANPNNLGMSLNLSSAESTSVQTPVPLVTHLHGGETQSFYDGTPNQWFTANGLHGTDYATKQETDSNSAVYYYNNAQQPTTLWYHDHALGVTRLTVQSGLSGFYIIRENSQNDQVAPLLPTGKYEVPLIIQDRSFQKNGSFYYPEVGNNPSLHPFWAQDFLGNTNMVNGKVWPNMNVDQGQYRFRLLDASNTRTYTFVLQNEETNQMVPFTQIGTDGGYLKTAAPLTSLTLSPGERADILVDFSGFSQGNKILLKNSALLDSNPDHTEAQTVGQVIQFTLTDKTGYASKQLPDLLNPTLAGSAFPNLPVPTYSRLLTLFEVDGANGMSQALLNGQLFSSAISELPVLGSTEDWSFIDLTGIEHSMHVHMVQFQIVSRQQINATAYKADWLALQRQQLGNQSASPPWPVNYSPKELALAFYLIGAPVPPSPSEQGWKDTVLVYSSEVVTIRLRFASQDGSSLPFDATKGPGYVWHCHLLEHEDNEMMRPFKIVSANSASFNILIPVILIVVAAIAIAVVVGLLYIRRRNPYKKSKYFGAPKPTLTGKSFTDRISWGFLAKAGLTIVVVSWLIYTGYWTYKFAAYTPNIKYNTDIFSSMSLIFLTVGAGARTVAGGFGLAIMAHVWKGKWSMTTRRLLITAVLLEAFYLLSYLPTAGVGPHISDPVLNVEATIPSIFEGLFVPIPLFILSLKLTKGEKAQGEAIKWGCISAVAYLFALYVRFNVQWFATFIQTPNYNPFDDVGLPGHGILYVLNYPINMLQFMLTLVGFMLICLFAVWAFLPAIRNPGKLPSSRRIGFILLFVGAYVITIAVLFGIFDHVGGHSIWSEFFAIHNVERWFVSLPLLAIPLIFKKEKIMEKTK